MSDRTIVILAIVGLAFWYVTNMKKTVVATTPTGRTVTPAVPGYQQQTGQDLFGNILGLINTVVQTVDDYSQTAPERN